jgi:hypothetical protein
VGKPDEDHRRSQNENSRVESPLVFSSGSNLRSTGDCDAQEKPKYCSTNQTEVGHKESCHEKEEMDTLLLPNFNFN